MPITGVSGFEPEQEIIPKFHPPFLFLPSSLIFSSPLLHPSSYLSPWFRFGENCLGKAPVRWHDIELETLNAAQLMRNCYGSL
jgi:hypothetical protein